GRGDDTTALDVEPEALQCVVGDRDVPEVDVGRGEVTGRVERFGLQPDADLALDPLALHDVAVGEDGDRIQSQVEHAAGVGDEVDPLRGGVGNPRVENGDVGDAVIGGVDLQPGAGRLEVDVHGIHGERRDGTGTIGLDGQAG